MSTFDDQTRSKVKAAINLLRIETLEYQFLMVIVIEGYLITYLYGAHQDWARHLTKIYGQHVIW